MRADACEIHLPLVLDMFLSADTNPRKINSEHNIIQPVYDVVPCSIFQTTVGSLHEVFNIF